MKPRYSSWLWLVSSKFLLAAAVASLQYCHDDDSVEFCVAMTTAHNATTHDADIYVTLGIESQPGLGWIAVGTGDSMAGSLMFFFLSDNEERFALSARTTTGHIPPHRISSDAAGPTTNLLSARVYNHSWQEVGFACYGCGNWPTLDITSSNQPWIFARNTKQRVTDALSLEVSIEKHETYGVLYADMQASHGLGQVTAPPTLYRLAAALTVCYSERRSWSCIHLEHF
ncbi:hypothetical protein B0H66DRAFT_608698 [Apodospora peruviana]|uniref:DOMON domain-containing protein n=1 Tax=Apodospora peruviana TaxID=516989 RepID=A0AAE0HT45_9PEZI|nr:hypothetical protein B0H66DRAFT_608698 [Apodospora peruviana]